MFLEAVTHLLQYKNILAAHFLSRFLSIEAVAQSSKYKTCSEAVAQSSWFLHKIYTLYVKIFHNLSMIMKNIFDGWFKNVTALCEYHRPRHNAYRNRQIIRACLAHMLQRLDHRP